MTFILTIIAFCAIHNSYSYLQKTFKKNTSDVGVIVPDNSINKKQTTKDIKIVEDNVIMENSKIVEVTNNTNPWQIEIPAIDLIAPIKEGTSQEILYTSVGHFEHTQIFDGNVGLAAHNKRISNKLF